MGFRGSLGFSPLGYASSEESEFSYVGDQKPRTGRSDSIFEDYKSKNDLSLVNSFSEKMKARQDLEAKEKPEKKVASYYLEVETLDKLKEWADARSASYSSVVEQAIRSHLAILDS